MSEQLKYKIYDHEVVPPVHVWNAIAEELNDQSSSSGVAGKLYGYEVTPPPGSWQTIATALDKGFSETPVRNIDRKVIVVTPVKRMPLRWIAAAAMLIFLMTGAYYILNKSGDAAPRIASASTVRAADEQTDKVVASSATQNKIVPDKTANDLPASYYASYAPRKKTVAANADKPLRCSHIKETNALTDNLVISITPHQILSESGEPIRDMSVVNPDNDKYISITAPNGQQTRISSKLAIAMPYFGNTDQGNGLPQENSNWKLLIQQWRDKIMHSAFTPSSTNFMDILEISDLIKD